MLMSPERDQSGAGAGCSQRPVVCVFNFLQTRVYNMNPGDFESTLLKLRTVKRDLGIEEATRDSLGGLLWLSRNSRETGALETVSGS